jgi:DNA mismatch endonuclease (patch repair protein)
MRAIRSKGMKPEMAVRSLVHSMGYRFRLHRKELPGKPDMVFLSRLAAIFVHGCFWHQHREPKCKDARQPKSNVDYWQPKLASNQARDVENESALAAQGWRVLVIWECELKDIDMLKKKIFTFLAD